MGERPGRTLRVQEVNKAGSWGAVPGNNQRARGSYPEKAWEGGGGEYEKQRGKARPLHGIKRGDQGRLTALARSGALLSSS